MKLSNIFYNTQSDSQLDVVLGDFGFATQYDENGLPAVGTIPYMAPEMLTTFPDYGVEVDIWSAGVVFVELVSMLTFVLVTFSAIWTKSFSNR